MIRREHLPWFEFVEEAKNRFTLNITPSIGHNVHDLTHQILTLSQWIWAWIGAIIEISVQEWFTRPDLQLHIVWHAWSVQLLHDWEPCISLDVLEEYLRSCWINRKSLGDVEHQD